MIRNFRMALLVMGLAWVAGGASICRAQATRDASDPAAITAGSDPAADGATEDKDSSQREAIGEARAIELLEEHLPELADMLALMKERRGAVYRRAMREIGRVSQRLQALERRDPELYLVELELWKVRAQLRWLLARTLAGGESTSEEQIDALVAQEYDLETQRQSLTKERLEEQLKKIGTELEMREKNRDSAIAEQIEQFSRRVSRLEGARLKRSADDGQ